MKKTYKVYHNPRRSKSRCALAYIDDKGDGAEVVDYMKNAPTAEELREILRMLNMPAEGLIRKNEEVYKKNFKGKKVTEDEWIKAMIAFPVLIERPIIVFNGKAVIARPTERIEELDWIFIF